jgi:hypothetical protein
LYTDLQGFKNLAAQKISLLDKAKARNIEFQGVRLAMEEMKKWTEENPNALACLPRMSYGEDQLNYVAPTKCQRIGEKLEWDLTGSIKIYTRLHTIATKLIDRGNLSNIGDLG